MPDCLQASLDSGPTFLLFSKFGGLPNLVRGKPLFPALILQPLASFLPHHWNVLSFIFGAIMWGPAPASVCAQVWH